MQRLTAPQDPNGNPRRLWVYYTEDGRIEEVFDEGFGGKPHRRRILRKHKLFKRHRKIVELPTIPIDVATYRSFLGR